MIDQIYVDKISYYINQNYNKNITLVKVANYVGFSSFYLSKLIKQNLDINYTTYLTLIRINKAKELLEQGELTVSEVAYDVGFSEPKYFSNVFKKTVGMSPSNYKKSVKE